MIIYQEITENLDTTLEATLTSKRMVVLTIVGIIAGCMLVMDIVLIQAVKHIVALQVGQKEDPSFRKGKNEKLFIWSDCNPSDIR